jgi:hypothetical protein
MAPLGLVVAAIGYNLVTLRTEVRKVAQLNDTGVHVSMVRWAEERIRQGHLPFDGWFPRLSLGLSQFHHYQSLPHILAGVLALVFGAQPTVSWTYYLLLSFWPLCIYWTMRLFGFNRWTAATTGLVAPLVMSVTGYGYEHASYIWRGNGVWSQLWGMWLFPLALVFTWRAVSRGKNYAIAALFVGLTIACHFLTGYLALIYIGLWVIVEPRQILRRLGRAAIVGVGGALVAAWVVVPLLVDSEWASRTQYNVGTFWADSYGWHKVLGWLFTGQIFDHGRWPVLTILAGIGVVASGRHFLRDERARAIIGFTVVGVLLFCGRDTVGFIVNRLPGGQDLLLQRFIIPVHLGGIFLAGLGASCLTQGAYARMRGWRPSVSPLPVAAGLVVVGLVGLAPAWVALARFDAQGAHWINQQRAYDATQGADFTSLAYQAEALGGGRVYAGSAAAPAADQPKVGFVPGYAYLLDDDVDAVGFTLRTLSLSGDVEVRFDDSNLAQYDLFNVRYVILPVGTPPKVPATIVSTVGQWRLWTVATTGYLRVVDTTAAITDNRTNVGKQTESFLSSSLPAQGLIPVVAFGGQAAAQPTVPVGAPPAGAPGSVDVQFDEPDNGVFGGVVSTTRAAVVMLKATYDPRWTVTVDGKRASTQMLAPSYVGVAVPPGQHRIEFRYKSYPYYWLLFAIGALVLVGLAVVPRRYHRLARTHAAHRQSP